MRERGRVEREREREGERERRREREREGERERERVGKEGGGSEDQRVSGSSRLLENIKRD